MTKLTVAATQMSCSWDLPANIDHAENLIRQAASLGANVILIQELFEAPYFCIDQDAGHFNLATTVEQNHSIKRFQSLAAELNVVLPCSWFERANKAYFNSLAMIDADGSILGVYRKSHIPNGPGYQEKHYFNPGDTGFKVWDTHFGKIGVGVCWDQWFPEAARCMALMGAELLMYPTAIGSEPEPAPAVDSSLHWQRTMQGHAAANIMPLVASNRIGTEKATQDEATEITFYGHSFIADHTGAVVQQADNSTESILIHEFDMDSIRQYRESWGVYRDRRPDLYRAITTLDGNL
jgi:N-carbamoylputrescine amidase